MKIFEASFLNWNNDKQTRTLEVRETTYDNGERAFYAVDVSGQGAYPGNNLGCGKLEGDEWRAIQRLVLDHGTQFLTAHEVQA